MEADPHLHRRRPIGIILATHDLEAVDAVLVHGVAGPDDGAVPVAHHDIVSVLEPV